MGYTLLEVSLFLAISGGLTLVAIVGLAPRLTNVRFTTAMKDLQSNVTKNVSASELGKNTASTKYTCSNLSGNLNVAVGTTDSSSCVLVGRLAVFAAGQVEYRPIIALRSTPTCSVTDKFSVDAIKICNLARVLTPDSTYQYSNGLKKVSTTTAKTSYGYVRSPDNNAEHRFIIDGPVDTAFQLQGVATISTDDVCYNLSSRTAKLTISTSSSQPKLVFNGACI